MTVLASGQEFRGDKPALPSLQARLACRAGMATTTAGVLLANAEEARTLTGLEADEAVLTLARRYRVVCVKLGRAGAIAATGGDVVRAEVQPLDRADTLGAGDAFAGGFLLSLVRGADLAVALRAGCDTATAALQATAARS